MGEIIYFDANRTIRQMMVSQLKAYGAKVVVLDALEQCEAALKSCHEPVALILDMTRHPEMLSKLQSIVPGYFNVPDRCILTTTLPTALAEYLPDKIDACFFKHVVERPFKRQEFTKFIEEIVKPYLMVPELKSQSLSQSVAVALNSSISQIVGEGVEQNAEDLSFSQQVDRQVDRIVCDVSEVLPVIPENADESSPKENSGSQPNIVQRISRANRSRAAGGRFSREGSWSRMVRESSQSNPAIQSPGASESQQRQRPVIRPGISRDSSRSMMAVGRVTHSGSQPGVSDSGSHPSSVRELESQGASVQPVVPESVIKNNDAVSVQPDLPESVIKNNDAASVQPDLPVPVIGDSDIDEDEKTILISSTALYREILRKRLECCDGVISEAFEKYRNQQESLLPVACFRNGRYVRRPYRTPLNASIVLTDEETKLLDALKTPQVLTEFVKRWPDAEAVAYRLFLFEFLDGVV